MRLSRDLIVVVILFVILIGLTVFAASIKKPDSDAASRLAYSTHNVEANGTQALQRWLEALGYRTHRIEGNSFSIPNNAHVVFLVNTFASFDERDQRTLLRWAERGNTLILADTASISAPNALMRALQQKGNRFLQTRADEVAIEQPILNSSPSVTATVHTWFGLNPERADYVQYLSAQGIPLLISFKQGRGRVWLCSTPYLFTNDGLRDEANATLVGAMFSDTPRDGLVAFDEYHLSVSHTTPADTQSLQAILFSTPWGWAILYALIITFTYLAINGQRLGRVLPLPQTIARRSPAEYVVSMAQLFRRAGKRSIAQKHYYQHLKRKLAQPYRINPDLPDGEFVAMLARHNDRIDQNALAQTLHALRQSHIGERGLVKLANQAIKFTQRRG